MRTEGGERWEGWLCEKGWRKKKRVGERKMRVIKGEVRGGEKERENCAKLVVQA